MQKAFTRSCLAHFQSSWAQKLPVLALAQRSSHSFSALSLPNSNILSKHFLQTPAFFQALEAKYSSWMTFLRRDDESGRREERANEDSEDEEVPQRRRPAQTNNRRQRGEEAEEEGQNRGRRSYSAEEGGQRSGGYGGYGSGSGAPQPPRGPRGPREDLSHPQEVCVKNLPRDFTEEDLEQHFGECGTIVRVNMLKNRETGSFRGIAFVRFDTDEAVEKALELHESNVGEKTIYVEKNLPRDQRPQREPREPREQRGDRAPRGGSDSGNRIYVGNLSFKASENSIRELFENCGAVTSVRIVTDENGRSRGFGFVDFASEDGCNEALAMNNASLDGRNLSIRTAQPKQNRQ